MALRMTIEDDDETPLESHEPYQLESDSDLEIDQHFGQQPPPHDDDAQPRRRHAAAPAAPKHDAKAERASYAARKLDAKLRTRAIQIAADAPPAPSADDAADEAEAAELRALARSLKKKKRERAAAPSAAADAPPTSEHVDAAPSLSSFSELSLSMPLLKALHEVGWEKPTPIQAAVIPVALLGRDICGSAVTGSGKTAAFLLPILERLAYRRRHVSSTRVLILTPTRELAAQCETVGRRLAAFLGVRFALVVGGLSPQTQEAELRTRPDVIVATPGRIIDLVRNSLSVGLDDVEILVLDEADRLLDLGFRAEVEEIVRTCPRERQTLLFSATISEEVAELANASLREPMQLKVDPLYNVAEKLRQEFVHVKSDREHEREALLLCLVTRVFKARTVIFLPSKKLAHRVRILFGLNSLRVAELHGNMTQLQRMHALESFTNGSADFLVATDLAGRGLDIPAVESVINYELPANMKTYVHRVGRTARAGRGGCAVSFVGERDRAFLKQVLKHASGTVLNRKVPKERIAYWTERIASLEQEMATVLREEAEDRALGVAEMQANKASNILEHHAEIMSRPARTWFQSAQERADAKAASKSQNPIAARVAAPVEDAAKAEAPVLRESKPKRDRFAGMTRVKRRRIQRLEALANDAVEEGERPLRGKAAVAAAQAKLPNQKQVARKAKSELRGAMPGLKKASVPRLNAAEKPEKKGADADSPGGRPRAGTDVSGHTAASQERRTRSRPPIAKKIRSRSKPKFTKSRGKKRS